MAVLGDINDLCFLFSGRKRNLASPTLLIRFFFSFLKYLNLHFYDFEKGENVWCDVDLINKAKDRDEFERSYCTIL